MKFYVCLLGCILPVSNTVRAGKCAHSSRPYKALLMPCLTGSSLRPRKTLAYLVFFSSNHPKINFCANQPFSVTQPFLKNIFNAEGIGVGDIVAKSNHDFELWQSALEVLLIDKADGFVQLIIDLLQHGVG